MDTGERCNDILTETHPCEGRAPSCSLHTDCRWFDWSAYSGCTCSCAGGQKTRERHVDVAPKGDGKLCDPSDRTQIMPCNTQSCDEGHCIDGAWGVWSTWGVCSAPCGGGLQWRQRSIKVEANECGAPATGRSKEVIKCNPQSCTKDAPCVFSGWSDWSACSCLCDGVMRRVRRIQDYGKGNGAWCVGSTKEIKGCNSCAKNPQLSVDCKLGLWDEWSACSATCGFGQYTRNRKVLQEPANGGLLCNGQLSEVQQCTAKVCPVLPGPQPCVWGMWMEWGACDKCGGQRKRNRQIKQMSGEGGRSCDLEDSEETGKCERQCHAPTYCEWGAWEERQSCSTPQRAGMMPCGHGTSRRGRYLKAMTQKVPRRLAPAPSAPTGELNNLDKNYEVLNAGVCDGEQTESVPCELNACPELCTPINCVLHDWNDWSASDCTGLCTRHRGTMQANNECGVPCEGALTETKECPTTCHKKPVTCAFGPWTTWGSCVAGQQQNFRTRAIITPEAINGGRACMGNTKEISACPTNKATDCAISAWTKWTPCSADCGPGQQNRMRSFVSHASQSGGERCTDPLEETAPCDLAPCGKDRDCIWADWTSWGGCTCSCGGGQQTRDRFIKVAPLGDGALCPVSDRTQIQPCNTQSCSDTVCVDAQWSEWMKWGECTTPCGGGLMWRSRKIMTEANECGLPVTGDDKEFKACNTYSCTVDKDCVLDIWSDWSACSCTSNGVQRRSRRIVSYGKGNGKFCMGSTKQIEGCNIPQVEKPQYPVDCTFAPWSQWLECSATCSTGQRERARTMATEAQNGGSSCQGPLSEMKQCDGGACPVPPGPKPCLWGSWMEWGACDKCGGQRKRSRQIVRMPEDGGTPCETRASEETTKCKRQCHKPVYCEWGKWQAEGECSVSCGTGSVKRVRYLAVTDEPLGLIERTEQFPGLVNDQKTIADGHLRDVVMSFACGGLVSFGIMMVATFALRARRSVQDVPHDRDDWACNPEAPLNPTVE